MPSIRITRFAGLIPQIDAKELPNDHAQIAHNCLLWDGWLRPMPQWVVDRTFYTNVLSLYVDPEFGNANGYSMDGDFQFAFRNQGEPFNTTDILGTYAPFQFAPSRKTTYNATPYRLGLPVPVPTSITQNVTPQNLSVYPISRTYAVTFLSGHMEGPPFVFTQLGNLYTGGNLIYEGDLVNLVFDIDPAIITQYEITGFRVYRTVPGFDTAEQVANPLETAFHLVDEIIGFPSIYVTVDPSNGWWQVNYVDGTPANLIPGDLLLSDQWMQPANTPGFLITKQPFFGQLEGGWAYNVNTYASQSPNYVQFSERYLYHAWPPQNLISIPDGIFGVAAFYDNLFIGTLNRPYHVHVNETDGEAINVTVRPFPDPYQCQPNTMVTTNFGAMYVSREGNLIALSADSSTVASKKIASPGDVIPTPTGTFKFSDTKRTAWWNGLFFTFGASGVAAVFNYPNPNNPEYPLGQLVTIDTPASDPIANVVTGYGLFASWLNNVYKFALPGFSYESAPKATYTWKSKRYVMPGLTTFAAAKVVNDTSGVLNVTINGYNAGGESTPSFTFSRSLNHSNPWRIPHQFKCLEFEFILSGTSVVQEFHIATSERDLVETPGA